MRPLLLSIFPSFDVGGAQSRFATLANHFGSEWRHAIVSMNGVTSARERLNSDVEVVFPEFDSRKGDLVGNLARFRSVIDSLAPTTMLTHNFGSIEWALAGRFGSFRHVHVEDGFGPEERTTQLRRRVWLRRVALRGRSIVLPSKTLLDIATRRWRFKPDRLHYIPNGIDVARFATSGTSLDWPSDNGSSGPIIGTVAALRPEKNVGRLIRAFSIVAAKIEARLLIIGDGPQRSELEALTRDLGLLERVRFAGHVATPDDLIKAFDIFAISSDTEQMPISLLEAMAAGKPTAATDVGDISQMLPPNGRAFVVPCDDSKLAEALLTLVGSPALRQELGRAAQLKSIAEFDQAEMFRKWSAILQNGPVR